MKLDIDIESKLLKNKVTSEEFEQFKSLINLIQQGNLNEQELYDKYKEIKFKEILDSGFEAFIEFFEPLGVTLQEAGEILDRNKNKLKILLHERFETVGIIISNQLLIEYLMNAVIIRKLRMDSESFSAQNFGFGKKIEFLGLTKEHKLFKEALQNVNRIRIGLVHHFKFDLNSIGTKEIYKFLKSIHTKNLEQLSKIEQIEKFTEFCIVYFGWQSNEVKKKFNELKIYYKEEGGVVKRTNATKKKIKSELKLKKKNNPHEIISMWLH